MPSPEAPSNQQLWHYSCRYLYSRSGPFVRMRFADDVWDATDAGQLTTRQMLRPANGSGRQFSATTRNGLCRSTKAVKYDRKSLNVLVFPPTVTSYLPMVTMPNAAQNPEQQQRSGGGLGDLRNYNRRDAVCPRSNHVSSWRPGYRCPECGILYWTKRKRYAAHDCLAGSYTRKRNRIHAVGKVGEMSGCA